MHNYALLLIVELMQVIQKEWEAKNSVYAKFESSKGSMRNYFDLVSKGAAKTKIFSSTMANTLSDVAFSSFEEEMVAKTYRKISNERWIHEARIMHKHMDLYLIDLLEANQIDQVLDYIDDPKTFYTCVLRRLIALKVPNVANDVSNEGEWTRFKRQVKDAVKKAALATLDGTNKELAQTFVDKLRDDGEYEECDNEDKKKFQEDCEKELNEAIENVNSLNDHEGFAKELSPEVVDQFYEEDCSFYFSKEDTVAKKYRDFTKIYPSWKDPRINEESPLREYILATYNNKIAEKCGLKPCPDVPQSYFRVLSTIKEQLKMEID
ncbi:hypothetical protein DAPPUDRAFT_322835 [Daphnia pulex]|uniref:Uncharacterized protein n=1 Tax=Daphnia pulex TaxID=6669 RepID=E9GX34_DAPPU|nr:hypothetical protein DAPPUDRAFT_322835 [Daphnia pulex]|eukprot:EFX76005.1 hypothetical protein DAPPUDRAFT_322835 [Daphnia pulex]